MAARVGVRSAAAPDVTELVQRRGDDALHVEDLYLACACVDGLPRAFAAFDERYLSAVPRSILRVLPPSVRARI